MYKVEYYKTLEDALSSTKTVLDNLTFEQAVEWFRTLVSNGNGYVTIVHPIAPAGQSKER